MKRMLLIPFLILSVLIPCGNAKCAAANNLRAKNDCYGWYFKKGENGSQPPLPSEFYFIKKHRAYYLNEKVKDDDKVIYLTFDAGYENGNIEKILDAMKAHNAKGAFFVLGNLIRKNPELVKRMVNEGHLVCNHTSSHKDMSKVESKEKFEKELNELSELMKEYCGSEISPFYRPPEGKFSELNLIHACELGYKTIFWSCAYADWDNACQPSPKAAMTKLMSRLHNGEILLLHPTSDTNAEIMDKLLTDLEAQGYRFGNLYELD